jgi:hypothetical protein
MIVFDTVIRMIDEPMDDIPCFVSPQKASLSPCWDNAISDLSPLLIGNHLAIISISLSPPLEHYEKRCDTEAQSTSPERVLASGFGANRFLKTRWVGF